MQTVPYGALDQPPVLSIVWLQPDSAGRHALGHIGTLVRIGRLVSLICRKLSPLKALPLVLRHTLPMEVHSRE